MSFTKIGQKAEAENINSVKFGDCVIKTTLSTGFDGNAPDEHKRDVTIIAELSDDSEVVKRMLDRLAGGIRITVNQNDGYLKGAPGVVDYESYANHLDSIDCEVHLTEDDLIELYTPNRRTSKDMSPQEGLDVLLKEGKISKEQHTQMSAMLEADQQ